MLPCSMQDPQLAHAKEEAPRGGAPGNGEEFTVGPTPK